MGLFSKRRNDGFDPELWTDADERAKGRGKGSWFDDLSSSEVDLADLETNEGAAFGDSDEAWLADDPGEKVRRGASG